jgi:hypothetical protein
VKGLRSLAAAVALAAFGVLPAAAAQAHAASQDRDAQPVSRPADQTRAQQVLARVLAREHDAYLVPNDPRTEAAQRVLTRTLAREHDSYRAPADAQQSANEQQAAQSGTFPLLPVLATAGLIVMLATAATWRLRARSHPWGAT